MTKNKTKNGNTNKLEDYGKLILAVRSGSISYGTNITEEMAKQIAVERGGNWEDYVSDTDVRGIFIPHRKYLLGSQKITQFEDPNEEDTMYYSLQRFLELALECNPNVVELLFVEEEDILFITEEGRQLIEMRQLFLSKNAYARFGSFAYAQLKKLLAKDVNDHQGSRKHLLDTFGVDTKAYMHHERLTDMGIEIFDEYTLRTRRPNAKELIGIRNGVAPDGTIITVEYIRVHAAEKQKKLEMAMRNSTIPNVPDFDTVNAWAVKVTDECHEMQEKFYKPLNLNPTNGIFKGNAFNVLPLEYEMIDKTTLLLVSNPLIRNKNKSQANGFCIPYKDWFTGLREFSEFKFKETTIEHINKFAYYTMTCNPRHIDVIYAGEENYLHEHELAAPLLEMLRKLPNAKQAYVKAKGYIEGNMKKLRHWENLKKVHNELKAKVEAAKKKTKEEWDAEFQTLYDEANAYNTKIMKVNDSDETIIKFDAKFEEFKAAYFAKYDSLNKQFKEWEELILKPRMGEYPAIPDGTPNDNSSMMTKYSFDTVLASELFHVGKMFVELLKTGTIQDSRAYESEMYAIKSGHFKEFGDFEAYMNEILAEMDEAKQNSPLKGMKYEEFTEWLIDFIDRYHAQLD